jgi:hypothetical protein
MTESARRTASPPRRRLLKTLVGGAAAAAGALPERWTRPVVDAVLLPAHAQATGAVTGAFSATTTTAVAARDGSPLDLLIPRAMADSGIGISVCINVTNGVADIVVSVNGILYSGSAALPFDVTLSADGVPGVFTPRITGDAANGGTEIQGTVYLAGSGGSGSAGYTASLGAGPCSLPAPSFSLIGGCTPAAGTSHDSTVSLTASVFVVPNPGAGQTVDVSYLCDSSPVGSTTVNTDANGQASVTVTGDGVSCGSGELTVRLSYAGQQHSCTWTIFPCFVAGTPVLLADGSLKAIETLREGDMVTSYDFAAGGAVARRVTDTLQRTVDSRLDLDGLGVTATHPFAVGEDQWKKAGDLAVGDTVLGRDGPISIGRIETVSGEVTVYNISVEGLENYYVSNGRDLYLVHNY